MQHEDDRRLANSVAYLDSDGNSRLDTHHTCGMISKLPDGFGDVTHIQMLDTLHGECDN